IDGVRQPSAISPASACIFGAVAATYTGGTSRGVSASSCRPGTSALHVSPSYVNGLPPSTPRTISTASRIGPSVRLPFRRALLRKIFDVPKPSRNRPGPAASWTTRASIATWTGCRVNGEMIPQPTVSRSVSFPIKADTTVEERASIPCLRHQGYASASQIVSMPARSMARADSSISSSGSMVSCITPMRKGCAIRSIFSRGQHLEVEGSRPERSIRPPRVLGHHSEFGVADRLVKGTCVGAVMCRQPQQREPTLERGLFDRLHEPPPDPPAAHAARHPDPLNLRAVVGIRRAAQGELPHRHHLAFLLADQEDPRGRIEARDALAIPALEGAPPHRVECAESHTGPQRVQVDRRQAAADAIRLRRADPTKAQGRPYESSVEVVGPSASASYDSGAHGLRPSSAPLEPSGSAGPSAGSPASLNSGSVSGGSRSVVGSGVSAFPISPLLMASPPAPACRARRAPARPAG